MGNKILITGGAGFIGTHLAERLVGNGSNEVVLLDNFRRDSLKYAPELQNHKHVTTITADIEDPEAIKSALKDVGAVVHLAAIAGVSSYYKEPLQTLNTNILGTVNVLKQASQADVSTFVYFSTSEVYGSDALWVDETTPHGIGPVSDLRWVYATSKLAGENFVLRYAEKFGFRCAVVRPFNIYGPRQIGEGAISNFCRAVVANLPLQVYGDGSAIRAWCYIDDLVDAVISIIGSPPQQPVVYNIGNPKEVETTLGLARRITSIDRKSGGSARYELHEGVHSEVRARIPNIERARSQINFAPKVDLEYGLTKTLEWFRLHEQS